MALLAFSFSSYAQNIEGVNARLDGMAGSGATDDIGWTISSPADIYKYPNQAQGTICLMPIPGVGKTYGDIVGIVALSSQFYAGLTLNDRMWMPAGDATGFYADAAKLMNVLVSESADGAKGFPNFPQANLCWRINDNFQVGTGGFFENASYSKKMNKQFVYAPAVAGADSIADYDQEMSDMSIRNNGFILDGRLTFGSITINPYFLKGIPLINGKQTSNLVSGLRTSLQSSNAAAAIPVTDTNLTFSSKQGELLKAGSNFWFDNGKILLIGGIFYTNKRYQFDKTTVVTSANLNPDGTGASTTLPSSDLLTVDNNWKMLDWWFAAQPVYADGLYFSPEYDGGYGWFTGEDPALYPKVKYIKIYYNFRLGVEKIRKHVWIFDECALRCGFMAQWNKELRTVYNPDNTTNTTEESPPWSSFFWGADFNNKHAKITGGLGLKIGRGSFDVSVDFLDWGGASGGSGTFSGPPAALATLGVDFGKSK